MKKIIEDVVSFPNGCETVRFTACLVSMLMCVRKETGERKHEQLYQRYNLAAGDSFLQIDLSNDGHMACSWELTSQKLLQEFDYYIEVVIDFAGYEFDKLEGGQESAFEKIKASIDRKIPVLMQLKKECQWVLVTCYDDEGTLYGLDGSQGYWGASPAEPSGYEGELFVLPDWSDKLAHAFVLGKRALNAVRGLCWTAHDVLWVAWKAIGEYMAGAPIEWAGGLKNKTIRSVIADCF